MLSSLMELKQLALKTTFLSLIKNGLESKKDATAREFLTPKCASKMGLFKDHALLLKEQKIATKQ